MKMDRSFEKDLDEFETLAGYAYDDGKMLVLALKCHDAIMRQPYGKPGHNRLSMREAWRRTVAVALCDFLVSMFGYKRAIARRDVCRLIREVWPKFRDNDLVRWEKWAHEHLRRCDTGPARRLYLEVFTYLAKHSERKRFASIMLEASKEFVL